MTGGHDQGLQEEEKTKTFARVLDYILIMLRNGGVVRVFGHTLKTMAFLH